MSKIGKNRKALNGIITFTNLRDTPQDTIMKKKDIVQDQKVIQEEKRKSISNHQLI